MREECGEEEETSPSHHAPWNPSVKLSITKVKINLYRCFDASYMELSRRETFAVVGCDSCSAYYLNGLISGTMATSHIIV